MAVIYEYTPTGFISGTTSNGALCKEPVFGNAASGNFLLTLHDYIKANMTCTEHDGKAQTFPDYTVVGGGWSFVLDKDNHPILDANGNYQLIPQQPQISPPTAADYAVLAAIKQGALVIGQDIHDDYIVKLNQALDSVSLPAIAGTSLIPLPVYTADSLTGPAAP